MSLSPIVKYKTFTLNHNIYINDIVLANVQETESGNCAAESLWGNSRVMGLRVSSAKSIRRRLGCTLIVHKRWLSNSFSRPYLGYFDRKETTNPHDQTTSLRFLTVIVVSSYLHTTQSIPGFQFPIVRCRRLLVFCRDCLVELWMMDRKQRKSNVEML